MLFEAFRRHRAERAESPAFLITSGDRYLSVSWKQFTDDIAAICWLIEKHSPGAKIAILGENSYEWMVVHAACLFSGATVVPLDVNLNVDDIARRLKFAGVEILIHVGVDTVEMKGDGFSPKVKVGDKVKQGDLLLEMDLGKIAASGHPAVVITVVTNTDDFKDVEVVASGAVEPGADLIKVSK